MATHKSYRARAAESFRSGLESPLEALGSRALREAQAELQRKAAEMEMDSDRDPAALEMLEEALAHEPRDAHERRAAARAFLGVTKSKSATRVDTKDNERDVWTSWVDVGFPIADKMMRAGIAERVESGRITEDEAQELLDLLDAIRDNSSNDKIEPDYYEDLVADMRELGDRVATMDWGNSFPYENWHRDADEIEKYGDGLRDWYGDDWKGAGAVRTKGFYVDFKCEPGDVEEVLTILRDAGGRVVDDPHGVKQGSSSASFENEADAQQAAKDIADLCDTVDVLDDESGEYLNSAGAVRTKGAMPIVAFDAANEEGLDDLEADVNDLAYKHNASGMDADTSGGHCEVYFEAAIDAANFAEALQAGDLIGYTVSSVELVPTDADDGEGKSASDVDTKGGEGFEVGQRVWVDGEESYGEITGIDEMTGITVLLESDGQEVDCGFEQVHPEDEGKSAGAVRTKGPRAYIVALDVGDLIDDGEVMRAIGALASDNNGGTRGSMMSSSTEWSFETEEDAEAFCDQVNQEYASEGFEAHLYYGPDGYYKDADVDTKGGAKPSKTGMRWAEENEYDLEEIATYIEDAADAQEDRAREEWGPDSDDPDKEMVSMLRNDAKDMRKLATAVRNGRLDDLEDLEPQDTAARDELPGEYYGLRDAWIDFQENGDEDEDYEASVGDVETKTAMERNLDDFFAWCADQGITSYTRGAVRKWIKAEGLEDEIDEDEFNEALDAWAEHGGAGGH